MDQKARQKISRTCFAALLAFLAMSFVFAMERDLISQINLWFLSMTGEVTITPSTEVAPPPEMTFRQEKLKEANKINKVTPPKPKPAQAVARKRPAEQGYYTVADSIDPDRATIYVHKKDNLVLNANNWKGPDDLSYRCRLSREAKGFLVTVVIKDNTLWAKNGQVQHQNDCVEIYFDVRPEKQRGKPTYENGVYHALIVPWYGAKANANTMIFHFGDDKPMPPGCWIKSNELPNFGYRVDAYFPFSMFAYPPGDEFNFDIGVIDYDDATHFKQMVWSGIAENYSNPQFFGKMKKLPPPETAAPVTPATTTKPAEAVSNQTPATTPAGTAAPAKQ